MSVSFKIILKKNKQNKEGEYPLYIRVTKDRITRFCATGIKLKEGLWDDIERKIKKGYPNSVRANNLLAQKYAEIQSKAIDWETKNKSIKQKRLKKELFKTSDESFSQYFRTYIDQLKATKKLGTLDKANATYSKLHVFAKTENLHFADIDVEFLKKFENYLRDKLNNKINTIHSNLKMMRKLFNDAVREELIPDHINPFSKYLLKTEKTNKEFLTENELQRIEALDLSNKPRLNDHRNMFVFSCDNAGMRISDLLQLKWKDFNDTHINFTQQKTNEQNAIRVPTKALQILQYYRGVTGSSDENYIFPFLRNDLHEDKVFDAISSQTAYANKNLKEIAKLAEINKPITTHIARHTWATRALSKGVRIEHVSKLLGHSSIKTTQVYAKIVNKELDKAMEVFDE